MLQPSTAAHDGEQSVAASLLSLRERKKSPNAAGTESMLAFA